MRVMVTGASGFIGQNLCTRLVERGGVEVVRVTRETAPGEIAALVQGVSTVFHLAGANRPAVTEEFEICNVGFTEALCEALSRAGNRATVVFTSSAQAGLENPYGRSKLGAERRLKDFAASHGNPVRVYRLPGVFGKWCRPNYNSVVATFCHNIARGLPVRVDDATKELRLVYVDDVVDSFIRLLDERPPASFEFAEVLPEHRISLGALVRQIEAFGTVRSSLMTERVGSGLVRALYSTYVSYLPSEAFGYPVAAHVDPRGRFVEMIKTADSGQVSYFTAAPGVTRGGHYHHSKTEKFLVAKGRARFRFRHMLTGENVELTTSGDSPTIVDTIPGWTHDITNVGEEEMIVVLWANEVFDRQRPDTIVKALA